MSTETLVSHDAPTPVPAALRNRSEFLEELARRGARSPDLLGAFEDMVSLVARSWTWTKTRSPIGGGANATAMRRSARAKRSLHRCAMNRGLT